MLEILFLAVVLGLISVNPFLSIALYFGGACLYFRSPSAEPGGGHIWVEDDVEEELFLWDEELF